MEGVTLINADDFTIASLGDWDVWLRDPFKTVAEYNAIRQRLFAMPFYGVADWQIECRWSRLKAMN
jgi:hypothetical protein